jgi:hypothetical protein
MQCEPRQNLLARVHRQVVADDVDERDRGWSLALDLSQQSDEVFLALPRSADSDDVPASNVEGSEQLQSTAPSVLVFHSDGRVRTRGPSGERSSTWLQGGFLVHAQDTLVGLQLTRVEVADLFGPSAKLFISRPFRTQPVVTSPWLEAIGRQYPLDRLSRDRLHDLVTFNTSERFDGLAEPLAPLPRVIVLRPLPE